MVERAEDRDLLRLRCPDRKIGAFNPLESRGVRAEFVIQMEVRALIEEIEIV
jgi:hypothetical protein